MHPEQVFPSLSGLLSQILHPSRYESPKQIPLQSIDSLFPKQIPQLSIFSFGVLFVFPPEQTLQSSQYALPLKFPLQS